jgi:hypothetical protein
MTSCRLTSLLPAHVTRSTAHDVLLLLYCLQV